VGIETISALACYRNPMTTGHTTTPASMAWTWERLRKTKASLTFFTSRWQRLGRAPAGPLAGPRVHPDTQWRTSSPPGLTTASWISPRLPFVFV
jgi:hypothetical protein